MAKIGEVRAAWVAADGAGLRAGRALALSQTGHLRCQHARSAKATIAWTVAL